MANFPLVTWPVALTGVTVSYDGGGPYDVADVTGYGFGVSSTSTKVASVDAGGVVGSIVGNLVAALNVAIPTVNPVSATYVYSDGTAPALGPLKAFFGVTGLLPVTVDFGSAAMAAVVGFSTQVVTLAPALGATTPFNVGGIWMPNGVAGDVRRYLTQRAAASSNEMSGLATDVVNWGQIVDLELMSSAFYAANVARYFAATQIYATAAGRLVADPNNTLEGMVEAAATGVLFRLYREAATAEGTTPGYYQPARMPSVAQQGKAVDMVAALDEPRLWNSSGIFFRATQ
jgi:hypothetical protein